MKDKIISAGTELFGEKGFSETSIQDIVNIIGVTKGTFYYYFNSKEELLRQIHLSFIEDLLVQQKSVLEDDTKTFKEKLHGIVTVLIKNIKIQGQRQSARIFFREMRHLNEEHLEDIIEKRNDFRLNLQTLLSEGKEQGELKEELRPDILSFAILGVSNWSYYWFNPDGDVTEEELVNIYVEMILNGISM